MKVTMPIDEGNPLTSSQRIHPPGLISSTRNPKAHGNEPISREDALRK